MDVIIGLLGHVYTMLDDFSQALKMELGKCPKYKIFY